MSLNFVLVPGPLVRASSWEPTAKQLRNSGHNVQTPDVLDNQPPPPAWRVDPGIDRQGRYRRVTGPSREIEKTAADVA